MDEKWKLSEGECELGTEEAKMIPDMETSSYTPTLNMAHKNCVHHFSLGLQQQTRLQFYYFCDKGGSNNDGGCGNDDGLLFRSVCVVLFQGTRDEPICVEVTEQGERKHCLTAAVAVLNRRGAIQTITMSS